MAGLRPRSLHTRSQSSIQGSTSTIDSIKDDGFVARPHQRPRSQSHHPSVSATKFADRQPLQGTLREYLLGKIELAEEGVKELEGMVVDEDHTTSYGSGSGSSSSSDGYAEDEWEVVSRKSKSRSSKRSSPTSTPSIPIKSTRSLLSPRPSKATASNLAPPSTSSVDQDTTLQQFLNAATNFLTAIKSELPTLSNSTSTSTSSSPLIHFQLSPQARKDLDKFLDDHPLPSVPGFKELTLLKACLDDSKRSCLSRLTIELNGLQQVLSGLANNVEAPTPLHSLHLMRDYFTNESDRLAQTLSSISSTTSSNLIDAAHILSAGANRVVDEATTLLATSSTAAFDEATRIYHAALEGGRIRLLSYEELPHQWKNNQHILSGYRFIGIDRWGAILKSAFQFHNETINIHSHFLGFLSLIYLSIFILPYSPAFSGGNHWGDKAIVLLFIGAGMKCLLCSTAWHLLSGCATGGWHRGAACVDYVGISGLIAASVMGMEYYGLYCQPRLAATYMTFTAALGVAGYILPWKPWFNMRKYKMWRVAFFLGVAASALMPLGHMSYLYSLSSTLSYFSPVFPSIAAYLIGLSFYANQFPECRNPGRCDMVGASHQVWHLAIVLAVWSHWRALAIWGNTPLDAFSCLA